MSFSDAAGESGSKPISQGQVKDSAHDLERIGDNFLSGRNEDAALKEWHQEINGLFNKGGIEAVRSVFQQMQTDNQGINPLLPHVDFREDGGKLQLSFAPSLPNAIFGLNYRDLVSTVTKDAVSSGGDAGRNFIVGQHHVSEYTSKRGSK